MSTSSPVSSGPAGNVQAPAQAAAPAEGGGGEQGGAAVDPRIASYLQGVQSEIQGLRSGQEESTRAQREQASRMQAAQRALSGEPDEAPNPDSEDQAFIDEFLEAALESQREGGKGLPLTTKLAVQQVQLKKELRAALTKIEALTGKTDTLTNPEFEMDRRTFLSFDSIVQDKIINLYGQPDPHIRKAVSDKLVATIQQVQKENPQAWDAIRRSPHYQEKMTLQALEAVIPTRARELLRQQHIQETPMGINELWTAFREAREQHKDNPKLQREVCANIRQQILSQTVGGKMR